ncbi:MAG: DUF2950 family protein [Planctomycetales bacterium]|nr:DUF2950 family protein [Planctomycetales bacterium]
MPRIALTVLASSLALAAGAWILASAGSAQEPRPGSAPAEERLARIERSLESLSRAVEGLAEDMRQTRRQVEELSTLLRGLTGAPPAPPGGGVVEGPVRAAPALEGPPSRSSRKIGTNESSAIGTLRALTTAQEQFKQQAVVDQDGNGTGEYGWLGELAGIDPTRGTGGVAGPKMSTSPFIASILGVKDSEGRAQKSGYYYRLFLPAAGAGPAKAETQAHAGTGSSADADNQEVRWACYAWPVKPGVSGNRAFFAGHQGEVYATAATKTRYDGISIVPAADAALEMQGPNPKNLDAGIGLAAAGLTSGDGNVWVPAGN